MPLDTALLASIEGPDQFQILSQAVEKNPEDFDSWTGLLAKLDDQVTLLFHFLFLGYSYY